MRTANENDETIKGAWMDGWSQNFETILYNTSILLKIIVIVTDCWNYLFWYGQHNAFLVFKD